MFYLIVAAVSCVLTALLTIGGLTLYFKRTLPAILEDAGANISDMLTEVFEKPTVKQAMSLMGKKSGDVRANKALVSKVSGKIMQQYPFLSTILNQFDITPEEGLRLMQDPMIGPWIQGMLQKGLKGVLGGTSKAEPLKGFGGYE
jgi:hypothetical protein